jgi:hypothetical protein
MTQIRGGTFVWVSGEDVVTSSGISGCWKLASATFSWFTPQGGRRPAAAAPEIDDENSSWSNRNTHKTAVAAALTDLELGRVFLHPTEVNILSTCAWLPQYYCFHIQAWREFVRRKYVARSLVSTSMPKSKLWECSRGEEQVVQGLASF